MRRLTLVGLLVAAPGLLWAAGPPPRALVGATLVDGTGRVPVADAVIVVEEGRIRCAGTRQDCPVPDGIDTLELAGFWITPGLVDAHVHFSQTGWADGRPDALDVRSRYPYEEVQAELRRRPDRFLRSYLCSGVTAVFDNGGYPWTWDLSHRLAGDASAPHVAAAGPLLSTLDSWLNLPAERQFIYLADEEAARRGVRYIASHGSAAVKVWFIRVGDRDPEEMVAAVRAAGDEAERQGLPLIVHATGLAEAKVAVQAGAHLLVHSVRDQPVDEELIEGMRARGTVYCPTLTVIGGYQRMYEAAAANRAPEVDDPNGCLDGWTRSKLAETASLDPGERDLESRRTRLQEFEETMAANLKSLHEAGLSIAMGTDAGNPLTLHGPSVYAEMEAMQEAGLEPLEVLVASTLGGARAMDRADELGTVEAGKIADLLVVEADPTADIAHLRQLRYVMRGGALRSVDELRPSE
jgi:imidazolonepropionase-like amidohydrolase